MNARRDSGAGAVLPADVARAAKVSNATLNYWLNDVNGMSAARARLVAEFLRVDPLWLETGEGAPDIAAPIVKATLSAPAEPPYADAERLLTLYRQADERGRREIMAVAIQEGGRVIGARNQA